ncbi:hypothetical protein ES288_D04G197800v1 [Gossypium darwinii]|uniref:peroxidase n=1 Tax=Gossypium darwinii TaxID=34276 RepID=A0A5D2D2V8_GOSDA|nr:hypothetical protein ES288_D04G197800v1 [Gossypium darwinii]
MAHKLVFSHNIASFIPFLLVFHFIPVVVSQFPYGYSQLSYRFYDWSCPRLTNMVKYGVWAAYRNDTRIAASLLRLHFHDCFVNVIPLLPSIFRI